MPCWTTNYLYDGNGEDVLEEVDSNGNVLARYTHGLDTDELLSELRSGTTSYYQQEDLSSVTSLSNAAGSLANTYSYDSYGNLIASTGTVTNPFQFTGRDNDLETGLYYYRARYFDPKLGRFVSEDPLGIRDNLNMYLYVHNNPPNFDDPFGLYQTRGFPADKQVELANAINEALAKLRSTCPSCAGADGPKIANAIENATFVYKPKMKPKLCGETGFFSFIGLRHEVGLGPSAFGPGCCSLASTVAHEAVHLTHGGENAAYGLEKKCFGCGN